MELSSSRFKAFAVTAGFSFWFAIITTGMGVFSFEALGIFAAIVIIITQIFAVKLVSLYGIFFKILRVDLLRLKKQSSSYWLDIDDIKQSRDIKQY